MSPNGDEQSLFEWIDVSIILSGFDNFMALGYKVRSAFPQYESCLQPNWWDCPNSQGSDALWLCSPWANSRLLCCSRSPCTSTPTWSRATHVGLPPCSPASQWLSSGIIYNSFRVGTCVDLLFVNPSCQLHERKIGTKLHRHFSKLTKPLHLLLTCNIVTSLCPDAPLSGALLPCTQDVWAISLWKKSWCHVSSCIFLNHGTQHKWARYALVNSNERRISDPLKG